MKRNQMNKLYRCCGLFLLMLSAAPVALAAGAYVDSVYGWGSWELGIEPAAGGPIPVANQPVAVQSNPQQFRPNANNAFTQRGETVMTTNTIPAPPPLPTTAPGVTTGPGGPGLGNVR